MEAIHIAYALDDRFAEMTCVSIASVLKNTEEKIVFHIIESRLSSEYISGIKKMISGYPNGSSIFYHIDIDSDTFVTSAATKVTKETYAKTMLPDLLKKQDRVIWLDGDTVIEEDINQLWSVELGDYCVAMAPDVSLAPKEIKKEILGINGDYYNTGVILMDLSKLRILRLAELVEENLPVIHKSIINASLEWYAEQDMINFVIKDKVKKLPIRFNCYIWEAALDNIPLSEVTDAFCKPVIIHYIGAEKPTKITRKFFPGPLWHRFFYYKTFTSFANPEDEAFITQYNEKKDNLLNSLLLPDNTHYLLLARFLRFESIEQTYQTLLKQTNNKKITIWGLCGITLHLIGYLASKGIQVTGIVDGTPDKINQMVYNLQVKPVESLQGDCNNTFVLLDMQNLDIAQQVMALLKSWGYTKNSYYHVYNQLWEGV